LDAYLINLRVLFITHIHMDHNIGLFKLLSERMETLKRVKRKNPELYGKVGEENALFLVVPKNCISMIARFQETVGDLGVKLIGAQDLTRVFGHFEKEKSNWEEMRNNEEDLILGSIDSPKMYKEQNDGLEVQQTLVWSQIEEKKQAEYGKKSPKLSFIGENLDSDANSNQKDPKKIAYEVPEQLPEGDPLKVIVYEDEKYTATIRQYEKYATSNIKEFLDFCEIAQIKSFVPMRVIHCPQSHGIAITSNYGWKLAYSGDCIPSINLIKKGKNATLLIHEATFASDTPEQAYAKMHSTVKDACDVARKMNAKRLVLTHFSQRYTVSEKANLPGKDKTKPSK
jgi:ribonuclease BN (tRNA processing enzyme)